MTLTIVATVAYREARESLGEAIFQQLSSTSALKEGEINRWVQEQVELIRFMAEVMATQPELGSRVSDLDVEEKERLSRFAAEAMRDGADFAEVFFLSAVGGKVLASTAPERVGDFHASDVFFLEGRYRTTTQNVYPSSRTGLPTLTVSAPVKDGSTTSALVAAHLDLDRLDRIVQDHHSGISSTEAYLVTPTHEFLSAARYGLPEYSRGVHSEGIRAAVSGRSSIGLYDNYRGVPVMGAYRWIPDRELVLMVEVSQQEALAPARALARHILTFGMAATLLLMVGVRFIALSVARPVVAVGDAAAMVAGGDFSVWIPEKGPDEVGDLARSFNAMTGKLRQLYSDLEGQVEVTTTTLSALEESRALLRSIIDNSTALIAVTNPQGELVVANQALLSLIGISAEEIGAQPLTPLLPAAVGAEWAEAMNVTIGKGEVVEREIFWNTEEGLRTYLCVWFPLTDDDGRAFGVGTIATDLSERKRVEEERLRIEAQFQHAQRLESLGVLAGGIAHDFNNILAAILGHADLAGECLEDEVVEAREHLDEVVAASHRATELTNQMLAYAGRASFRVESLDLNQAIREMSSLIAVSLPKKVVLASDLSTETLLVRADPAQISQVVMNLITNAADAIGDEPGRVQLCTSASTGSGGRSSAVLRVRDSGCGMSSSTLDRIFDPFYTTSEHGHGLGLAAVTGIVGGLGGTIEVDSEIGKGTTFRVSFPLDLTVDAEGVHGPTAEPGARAGTVLVVDDEDAVRVFTQRALQREGFAVLEAPDGLRALEVYRRESSRIDAVVLDLSMPGMGGREVFEVLRRADRNLPVLFTSGYDPSDAASALDGATAVRFLQKPYRPTALGDELRRLLSGSNGRGSGQQQPKP